MVVSDRVQGMLMGVSLGGVAVQCETEADFSYTIDMLPATNPSEGRWRRFIPGVQTWNVTVNGNLLLESLGADFKTLVESAKNGERLLLRFGTITGVEPAYGIEGYVYPSNLVLGATNTDLATWTVTFQGDGAFETTGDMFSAMAVQSSQWPDLIETENE